MRSTLTAVRERAQYRPTATLLTYVRQPFFRVNITVDAVSGGVAITPTLRVVQEAINEMCRTVLSSLKQVRHHVLVGHAWCCSAQIALRFRSFVVCFGRLLLVFSELRACILSGGLCTH